jgi:hypothetical protein
MLFPLIAPKQCLKSVGWMRLDQTPVAITLINCPLKFSAEMIKQIERALHPVIERSGIGLNIGCGIAAANSNLKLGETTICI